VSDNLVKDAGALVNAANAARILIAFVMSAEASEGGRRSVKSELSLDVDLRGGGKETWLITIERTASTH